MNDERLQELKDSGVSREEMLNHLRQTNEQVIEIGTTPPLKHNWVRRGIKVSCEGADHPCHSHYLTNPTKH